MRRLLAGLGRALVTVGLLVLLFVAYQLWGTGIYTSRAQHRLEQQFQAALEGIPRSTLPIASLTTPPIRNSTVASTTTTTMPRHPAPDEGDPVAQIAIDTIGVDYTVVEGVSLDDLRQGPGHYIGTALPGERGNAAIAGHRTTYGAPFERLDELEPGDEIRITNLQNITVTYVVYRTLIVSPDQVEVLDVDPTRAATLTLTTCNPKFEATERLVVKAELQLPTGAEPLIPATQSSGPAIADLGGANLSGQQSSRLPTLLWGVLAAVAGLAWWLLFHRHPRWTTWLIGAPVFLAVLFAFYFYLERLLPSNY